jgi:CRP-like cAMP-binding protein
VPAEAPVERVLEAGEVLFAEGEPPALVARILAGAVEVVKRAGEGEIVLARLGPPEHVGEMAVLEGRPRSATVRARERTRLALIGREAFLEQVASEPELAHRLLVTLSERLHRADQALAERDGPARPGAAAAAAVPGLRLVAASPAMQAVLPADGVAIGSLPFSVGRAVEAEERAPDPPVDLALPDLRPFRLSRLHFRFERTRTGVALVDASSTLGTLVDGAALGGPFARSRVELGRGEHRIVAGGEGSPFVFRLRVD